MILFKDDTLLREYRCEILIGKPSNNLNRLPSLLGRSLLNRWRMVYDPNGDRLEMSHRG